jgi:apolipoprotein D and lipocalin family protein
MTRRGLIASAAAAISLVAAFGWDALRAKPFPDNQTFGQAVDLHQFAGDWYQIIEDSGDDARLFAWANGVSKPCFGVRIRYVVEDGGLRLTNTCNEGAHDGRLIQIAGSARPTDPLNTRLIVRFDPWYLKPFTFDYWIAYVDETYSLAILASPQSKGVTILSRTSNLAPAASHEATQRAAALGYDLSKTRVTPQSD